MVASVINLLSLSFSFLHNKKKCPAEIISRQGILRLELPTLSRFKVAGVRHQYPSIMMNVYLTTFKY